MANLFNRNIGTNYKGILNLNTLNGNLSGTLQAVTDGDGNTSPLQLSTSQVGFANFAGATTGNIIWRANGTLTDYTGWHQSDGEFRFITKNGSPVFFNISYGINFSSGFSGTGRSSIDSSGNWNIGGAFSPLARLHLRGASGVADIFRSENNAATQGLIHTISGDTNQLFLGRFADTSISGSILYDNSSGIFTIKNNYTPAPNFGFMDLQHGQTILRIQNGTTPISLRISGTSVFNVNNVGAIAIGNTVTSAVAIASTHKVSVVINGVTYFLLASDI
jgi:hypothetical protein